MRALISMPKSGPNHVARAAFAAVIGAIKSQAPQKVLRSLYPGDEKSLSVLQRATVAPATTTQGGWASELTQTAFRAFLTDLQPISAASRLIALGVPALLDGFTEGKYPARSGAPATVGWVSEGGAIPVAQRLLSTITIGPTRKLALLTVFTREMATRTDAEEVFTQLLREDTAATLDAVYFSTAAGSGSAHAGLLYGLSAIPASSAGGDAAMKADLTALVAAVAAGGSGQVVFIMSTVDATTFPINFPETANKVTIFGSTAVPDGRIIAVDPVSLLHGTDPAPSIDASNDTAVHMSDAATQLSVAGAPPTVAAPVVSMFQSGQIALRILADIAFAKRRAGAVAYIDGADWSAVA
ncbi:hypothetical protein [Tardiphaga sp. 285_C5_N1_2]|uniref:hypothetical protein n=1 Tax=Tardiphaga sp. 285_C5_N1_2 TaxID=3240775 RepID=UPI003F8A5F73